MDFIEFEGQMRVVHCQLLKRRGYYVDFDFLHGKSMDEYRRGYPTVSDAINRDFIEHHIKFHTPDNNQAVIDYFMNVYYQGVSIYHDMEFIIDLERRKYEIMFFETQKPELSDIEKQWLQCKFQLTSYWPKRHDLSHSSFHFGDSFKNSNVIWDDAQMLRLSLLRKRIIEYKDEQYVYTDLAKGFQL